MKLTLVAVGRPRGAIAEATAAYEQRLRRYYAFEAVEVREEPARRGGDLARVREEEGERLLTRVPAGAQIVALHREGATWRSEKLAAYLEELALRSSPGVALLIGGAYGLADSVLRRANVQLSLSGFTLPHELARLVLTEQLYRAGTISRGEPYHKAPAP